MKIPLRTWLMAPLTVVTVGCGVSPDATAVGRSPLSSVEADGGRRTLAASFDKTLMGSRGMPVGATLMVCAPPPIGPRPAQVEMAFCNDRHRRCTALISLPEAELSLILPILDPEHPLRAVADVAECA